MKKQIVIIIFFLLVSNVQLLAQVNPNETVAANIILTADLDGDGAISNFEAHDELLQNFELIDTNQDKFIDHPELVFYLSNLKID